MLNRSFGSLWIGQSLANFGDVFYVVALISLVFSVTQSAFATSFVPILFVAAQFISGMLAPLLIDRYRLTRILVSSQAAKTFLLLMLTLFSTTLLSSNTILVVFLFVFLLAFLDGWATPSRNALVPILVSEAGLIRANSLLATSDQTVQFVGWAFGGVLVAFLGGENVLWISVALYFCSTLLMALIREPKTEDTEDQEKKTKSQSLREGWLIIWRTPILRSIAFVDVLENFAGAVWIAAILLVYVKQVLGKGEEWWGYINASYMAGMILGGILVLAVSQRIDAQLRRAIFIGSVFACLITFCFGFTTSAISALLLSFLLGPFHQLQQVAKQTAFQKNVAEGVMAKALSAKYTLDALVFGVSVFFMSLFADMWSVQATFFISASLIALAAITIKTTRF